MYFWRGESAFSPLHQSGTATHAMGCTLPYQEERTLAGQERSMRLQASRQFWSKNVRYLVQFAGHLTQRSFLGYGGSSRHSRHHSGEDRRLCVTPHAVPSPCGRVGVAPLPRPSVGDAAYEDRLTA